MSLNPGGQNYSWNYSRPDKDDYSLQLVGTVVSFQEIQAHKYNQSNPSQPGAPDFWDDGNPKMNIRMGLATETGELKAFVFTPAGKQAREGKKASIHMDLFYLSGGNITNLIGKTIVLSTQEPPQGWKWGVGNPRPWHVELLENTGPFQLSSPLPEEFKVPRLLADSSASGGQVQPPQPPQPRPQMAAQPQQQPRFQGYGQPVQQRPPVQYGGYQPQPMQYGGQQQQPVQYGGYQPQPMQQPAQQWAQQQPVQQMPQPQYDIRTPMPQPQPQAQQPVEMNPQIAEAMQALNATSAEVIPAPQPTGDAVGNGQTYEDVYDEDMPF